MLDQHFKLNEETLPLVGEIGNYVPGGFFIYKAAGDGEVLYANSAAHRIFGCKGDDDFAQLTGNTFRGMVHPDDYDTVCESITNQISSNATRLDYVE